VVVATAVVLREVVVVPVPPLVYAVLPPRSAELEAPPVVETPPFSFRSVLLPPSSDHRLVETNCEPPALSEAEAASVPPALVRLALVPPALVPLAADDDAPPALGALLVRLNPPLGLEELLLTPPEPPGD